MKKTIIFMGLVLIIVQSCTKEKNYWLKNNPKMACLPENLQMGVIAFYPFSNGSLNDFSGNNHHLTNTTTAHSSSDRNGNNNCAFEFNYLSSSSNEFLTTSNTTFLNGLTRFSISLWYQALDTIIKTTDSEVLISRGQNYSCPDRFGQWSVCLYDCRNAVFGRNSSVWEIPSGLDCKQQYMSITGNWYHLVATYSSVNHEMKLYKNGVLQNTENGFADCGFSGVPTVNDLGDLFLGKNYTGKLDDIILYNKTLNQSEVTQLYGLKTCCSK